MKSPTCELHIPAEFDSTDHLLKRPTSTSLTFRMNSSCFSSGFTLFTKPSSATIKESELMEEFQGDNWSLIWLLWGEFLTITFT